MDLIRELNRTLEMTVIMVTHERSLAERYANRLVFLGDGKLLGELENTPASAKTALPGNPGVEKIGAVR
jgi:energy-coupling factor transporter ATP-binding protein EcfA2